ncbi:GntR family transcriptional regulator [Halarsenatibacter silvermanii]|uniref:DNA-binding transcriptional regulator, GntR family n=1 Tax=Halarsenatibacter silvermanii TaxID=321763 RepID=A0A1G9GWW0_9FIRM|nr:GntR family transcriptional regulator [Halarsenatibacter silvermanii]SDL05161.1 DNA-binding transcriptional regulator, GntR family [Halarsenatibacter silvermanii]
MSSQKFQHRKLSTRVAEYLKEQIFKKNYKRGEHIPETEIADELGVSRAPVREAIKELENQGLIETIPRRGSYVVDFGEENLKEIYEIRILLETRVLEILIEGDLLDEEDFSHLEGLVEKMLAIVDKNKSQREKVVELNRVDISFHKYLWKKSEREMTRELLGRIYNQLKLAMIVDTHLEEDLKESSRTHYRIIEALKEDDIEKAHQALIDHIVSFNRELMERPQYELNL